jgi:hypothetical protein
MKHRLLPILILLPVLILAACSLTTSATEAPKVAPPNPTETEAPAVTPPSPPEKDKATVIGRAVDKDTQAPLANTIIRLAEVYGEGQDGAYVLDAYFSPGATTDANGYFIMENVPAIGYVVVVGDVFDVYKVIQTEKGTPKVWTTTPGEVLDLGTLPVSLKVELEATPTP